MTPLKAPPSKFSTFRCMVVGLCFIVLSLLLLPSLLPRALALSLSLSLSLSRVVVLYHQRVPKRR